MAITQVSTLDQTVVARYESDYLLWAEKTAVWGQIVDWQDPVPQDGGGGSSFDWPVFHELSPATTALTESTDVTPVALADSNVSLTPYEYGSAVQVTRKLRFQSRANVREATAKVVGQNQARTIDRLIRTALLTGTWMHRPLGVARSTLDTTSHLPTYAYLAELVAQARSSFIEPWDGNMYLSLVHPLTAVQIRENSEFKNPAYYQNQLVGGLLRGEIGELAGIRFIEHPYGKLYLCGGAVAQAATTIVSSVAAGATALAATTSTGLAVGDYVVVGTLEADTAEIVRLTAKSGVSYTIQAVGNTFGNFGFKMSHAAEVALTEAAQVGHIPVIGRQSLRGVYGQTTGKLGEPTIVEGPDSADLLGRFLTFGWYWYGGFAPLEKYLIQGEAAVKGGLIGAVTDN